MAPCLTGGGDLDVIMGIIFAPIIAQSGLLPLNVGTGAPVDPIGCQGLLLDSAGAIYASTTTPPARYYYGLPFDADGRLVVEEAAISYYDQGLPFTSSNALAATTGSSSLTYNQGMPLGDGGALLASGLAPPTPPGPPTTWGPLDQDFNNPDFTGADVSAIESDGAGVVIVFGDNGAASRSTDNGVTWTPLTQGLNSGNVNTHFRDARCDRNGTWIAVGGFGNQSGDVHAAISTDNGLTWSFLNPNTGSAVGYLYSVDTDRNGVWVIWARDSWASRSTDNGATFTPLPQGLNTGFNNNSPISHVRTDRQGNWVAFAYTQIGCARSTDNGATWTGIVLGGSAMGLGGACADANGVFVAGGQALGVGRRSADGGATWATINFGSGANVHNSVDCDDFGNVVAIGTTGHASYSINSGANYTALPQYLNSGGATAGRAICSDKAFTGRWWAGFDSAFGATSPPFP